MTRNFTALAPFPFQISQHLNEQSGTEGKDAEVQAGSDQLGAAGETRLNKLTQLQCSATAQHLPSRHKVQDSVSEPQNNKDTKLPTRQSRSRPILSLRADPSL